MFKLTGTSWKGTSTELCNFSRMKVLLTMCLFFGGEGGGGGTDLSYVAVKVKPCHISRTYSWVCF